MNEPAMMIPGKNIQWMFVTIMTKSLAVIVKHIFMELKRATMKE
jgi:hypothetical protein